MMIQADNIARAICSCRSGFIPELLLEDAGVSKKKLAAEAAPTGAP
jgi:hypothetical protein